MKRFAAIFSLGLLTGLGLAFATQTTGGKVYPSIDQSIPLPAGDVLFSDDLVQETDDLLASASAEPRTQQAPLEATPVSPVPVVQVSGLLRTVNEYRAGHGFGPLQRYNGLCEYASSRQGEISSGSHGSFMQGNWQSYCPGCSYLGENLSFGYSDDRALSEWLGSDAHKVNIEGDWKFGCVSHFSGDIVVLSVGK